MPATGLIVTAWEVLKAGISLTSRQRRALEAADFSNMPRGLSARRRSLIFRNHRQREYPPPPCAKKLGKWRGPFLPSEPELVGLRGTDGRNDIVTKVPIEVATGRQLGRQESPPKQAIDALNARLPGSAEWRACHS
jgi:hypothetical protein